MEFSLIRVKDINSKEFYGWAYFDKSVEGIEMKPFNKVKRLDIVEDNRGYKRIRCSN